MDGNAAIPKAVFVDRQTELHAKLPLRVVLVDPFGALSFLLTGGFQSLGLPWKLIRLLSAVENQLDCRLRSLLSLRALFVFCRSSETPARV
jgi:hypothetical protein